MPVHVVTDSSSCLPAELAAAAGITVVPIHVDVDDAGVTTASLSALELTAVYARLLERGGDDGVVALHLSKELSATWTNAVTAAGVFDGLVDVVDTNAAGMMLGFAALEAARVADTGADVATVGAAARAVLEGSHLWLNVPKIDFLRRGGRLSTGQTLLTTALAVKPILHLQEGRLTLAARTRTQAKAMEKLVLLCTEAVRECPGPVSVAIHHSDNEERSAELLAQIEQRLREAEPEGDVLERVELLDLPLSDVIAAHTGPGALGLVVSPRDVEVAPGDGSGDGEGAGSGEDAEA